MSINWLDITNQSGIDAESRDAAIAWLKQLESKSPESDTLLLDPSEAKALRVVSFGKRFGIGTLRAPVNLAIMAELARTPLSPEIEQVSQRFGDAMTFDAVPPVDYASMEIRSAANLFNGHSTSKPGARESRLLNYLAGHGSPLNIAVLRGSDGTVAFDYETQSVSTLQAGAVDWSSVKLRRSRVPVAPFASRQAKRKEDRAAWEMLGSMPTQTGRMSSDRRDTLLWEVLGKQPTQTGRMRSDRRSISLWEESLLQPKLRRRGWMDFGAWEKPGFGAVQGVAGRLHDRRMGWGK